MLFLNVEKNKRRAEDANGNSALMTASRANKSAIKSIMPCVALGMLRVKSLVFCFFLNYHTDDYVRCFVNE